MDVGVSFEVCTTCINGCVPALILKRSRSFIAFVGVFVLIFVCTAA